MLSKETSKFEQRRHGAVIYIYTLTLLNSPQRQSHRSVQMITNAKVELLRHFRNDDYQRNRRKQKGAGQLNSF